MAQPLRIRDLLLGAALVTGLVAAPPLVGGGGGGFNNGNSLDRGDNPVVGSLPCMVDPDLLDRFWVPFQAPKPGSLELLGVPATLGVIGTPELALELLDAFGAGTGFIDRPAGWACLGLVEDAVVILDRYLVADGTTDLWQYLPDGYLGGNVHVSSSAGEVDQPILSQNVGIPLTAYANYPEVFGRITLTIDPPAGSALDTKVVLIELEGAMLFIQYLP
ncbi:MAG: hypothetical protein ISR76_00650 [Planctomycetes bacterium]|nr:hypothetical protein [Planctomycetota bacterium]MBL7007480.1 hypothetical protein [Planctomycetota bacterium]